MNTLSKLLVRKFIKNYQQTNIPEIRDKYGYLSGIIGILANVTLFGLKLAVGIIINSIAFIGDAFNNLSDATSSLVTIIGFKLAGKPADEEHPFGHGRLEYIAGLIVAFLIMLVGYELLKSSVSRIFNPVEVLFSWPALLVLLLAMVVKLWLFIFNRFLARSINSQALLAASYDSFTDMIAMGCIGISLISSQFTKFPLDAYAGIVVAGIILYAGFSLAKETISPLLGEVPDKELIAQIKEKILSYEKVAGIHDLIVHSYGPGQYMASIHVELPADQDIIAMHEYIDDIERHVAEELDILLTIHLDPLNLDSEELASMQSELEQILEKFPTVLSFHDLRIVGKGEKENLVFDIVIPKTTKKEEQKKLVQAINQKVQESHPYYNCVITIDQNDMLT
ncbi:MAG: cation transporter [Peptococcaceae bacterium]|nr:cation transporter [Peptococcaceae bacterium]